MSKRSKIFTIIIILVLTIIFGVQLYIIWINSIPLIQGRQEKILLTAELEQKITDLEYMLANTDDPEVIRKIAEELLGLVSPDEIIISSSQD